MKIPKSIFGNRFPDPDDDDDAIAPDVSRHDEQPIPSAEAVRLEREKFAESSLDENRDDQFDAHHADSDEHL